MARRIGFRTLLVIGAASAAYAPSKVSAQIDLNPPMPNVLLLLDTSGSLERMEDGRLPSASSIPGSAEPNAGLDNQCLNGGTYEPNRWSTVVQALTGELNNPSCDILYRNSAEFRSYYDWPGTTVPYDYNYYLPFHRIMSNGCTPVPNRAVVDPEDWWEFPTNAITYEDASGSSCTGFSQLNNGILDIYGGRVRFGLMTFDTLTEPGTGYTSGGSWASSGMDGQWSYWFTNGTDNWRSGTGSATGFPPGCGFDLPIEVGARNPAAPPWEGRLMGFGVYDKDFSDVMDQNEKIQQVILSMRPYGATPLTGMMSDAFDLITQDRAAGCADQSTCTFSPSSYEDPVLGPQDDPYWDPDKTGTNQCRRNFIVLLSDGEPNLDLRPDCFPGGECPFDDIPLFGGGSHGPERYAEELSNAPWNIPVYVVGLGVRNVTVTSDPPNNGTYDCSTDIDATDFVSGGLCEEDANGSHAGPLEMAACCSLFKIADSGQTGTPYYPSNISDLQDVFDQILADITSEATSRTTPVFSTVSSTVSQGNAPATGYQFISSLNGGLGEDLWSGNLERKRYECDAGPPPTPELRDIEESRGDDFAANLNNNISSRTFWSYNPPAASGDYWARSIRPALSSDPDGIGQNQGTAMGGNPGSIGNLNSYVTNDSMFPNLTVPSLCDTEFGGGDGTIGSGTLGTCKASALDYLAGADLGLTDWGARNSAMGAIYHSTPVVMGPPREFLRDEAYNRYADAEARRPIMLYTATTDGQLHAFRVATNSNATDTYASYNDPSLNDPVDDNSLNELWSFIPPAVLPYIATNSGRQAILLDGQPVVQDVVFDRNLTTAQLGYSGATWRRVLLGGSGPSVAGGFYYAIDITDPDSPTFLWQLHSTNDDERLFGDSVPKPAIATIAIGEPPNRQEIAVAILPGGSGSGDSATLEANCDGIGDLGRTRQYITESISPFALPSVGVRDEVRCWPNTATNSGRSVTIVRLDTGEVIMNFRATLAEGPTISSAIRDCVMGSCATNDNAMIVPFDSPMTGQPVPYPGRPGQIASRIYIGDEDGTLWRINLEAPNPEDWDVEIAWDAYYDQSGATAGIIGEPIETPPIVSVDEVGNTIVLFSTGDQDQLEYDAGALNRVWSITDRPTSGSFLADVNWNLELLDGARVTGPIALFDSIAYFSTFVPAASIGCEDGHSDIYGVDYIATENGTPDYDPVGAIEDFTSPGTIVVSNSLDPGTIVFGLGVTQVPACSDPPAPFTDPYLGASYNALSNVNAGEYQLVFHTGAVGSKIDPNASVNMDVKSLPTPVASTRVTSWASIVE